MLGILLVATPEEFLEATPHERRRLVYRQIRRTRWKWNQKEWVSRSGGEGATCGTSYCFAGWACALAGDTFVSKGSVVPAADDGGHLAERICSRAQDLLGLGYRQADRLFAGSNSMRDIGRLLDRYEVPEDAV